MGLQGASCLFLVSMTSNILRQLLRMVITLLLLLPVRVKLPRLLDVSLILFLKMLNLNKFWKISNLLRRVLLKSLVINVAGTLIPISTKHVE